MRNQHYFNLILSFISIFVLSSHVGASFAGGGSSKNPNPNPNPFTQKAYAIRYWNNKIYKVGRPEFLMKKASPLSASESARFAELAAKNKLSTQLDSFCKVANLFCFPDPSPNLDKHDSDLKFSAYSHQKNFTSYGSGRAGGFDSFKNYSSDENLPVNSFQRYSHDSSGHKEDFTSYATNGNVISQTFKSYSGGSTGGAGNFTAYATNVNEPGLKFTTYSDQANGRANTFNTYSSESNAGDQGFSNYAKNGNGVTNTFKEYGKDDNVMGSTFSSYSKAGNAGVDKFMSYGYNGNVPLNKFNGYGDGENSGYHGFTSYRDQANVGDDSFISYGKSSNHEKVRFDNYDGSFNIGSDNFSSYGSGDTDNPDIGFKKYGEVNNFKEYAKSGVSFSLYRNSSGDSTMVVKNDGKGKMVNKWIEKGRFFRERELKEGNVMPMPNIKDKMPKRSFLPRGIMTKLPFNSSEISKLKEIFHAFDNSTMETILNDALHECERAPSPGETKKCVGSLEDMIDFAVSILGRASEPRTTENVNGSGSNILIGKVRGINGGNVTQSVSCHQSLYPYLLYYCHFVPKVRVYEVDILDPNTKSKINHGVAICHLDTSVWSPTHGAFLAIGPGPGKIEVCHWIFENDLTWTIAY